MPLNIFQANSGNTPQQIHITYEEVKKNYKRSPRRICFSSYHKNSLKRENGKYKGKFSIPFLDSIYPIFHEFTKADLFKSPFGNYWRSISDEEEYESIRKFIGVTRELVFLRDTLAISIALGENFDSDGNYTEMGKCENHAKYRDSEVAKKIIVDKSLKFLSKMPFYNDASYICAVPSSIPNEENLPKEIVANLDNNIPHENISNLVQFNKEKPPLKNLGLEHKWKNLCESDVCINKNLNGEDVVLVDDLYQSGTTMQYLAMKLQERGAGKIYGLAFVKSRSDSDNT